MTPPLLQRLWIENYRSLRDVCLDLGQLTVVTGPNGSGKSNLYSSLGLFHAAAAGRLGPALLEQGGMPSALWAGSRAKGPVRMRLTATFDDITLELVMGLPQLMSNTSPFVLDPEIKEEALYVGRTKRSSTTIVDRGPWAATVTTMDGERRQVSGLDASESILSQISDPGGNPELFEIRRRLLGWRFYHQFDTSPSSPARHTQAGIRTNALDPSGRDLAATIATLEERGDAAPLHRAVGSAFPGYECVVDGNTTGRFSIGLAAPGLHRPLTGRELSDGQLRFLCLAAALLTTRPPTLLVLNEPETSLHPSAVEALAPLIIEASERTQVWVTTHDRTLRDLLAAGGTVLDLSIDGGETTVHSAGT